jgi:exonuclease SbcC
MNPADLAKRVTERFPDALRIDDTIVQFTRRAAAQPFARYYLDCTPNIPQNLEALRTYQDRVIGKQYFDGPLSLQWNNYLYFIATESQLQNPGISRLRDFLEQDRAFARKFIVSENEIDQILVPPVVGPSEVVEQSSVLSIWNSRLAETGLGAAVWGDQDLPRRLSIIEARTVPPVSVDHESTQSRVLGPGRSISSFELLHYRNYPLERHFQFGKVNLILGPNASGKTSLLEAIELFYCGRNKRTPNARAKYDIRAILSDGSKERVTNGRHLKELRERNLQWYGQPEVQTNNLYASFARFNFLDTDAAVHLADAASNIVEDLSKLLIGPDAAKTWESMLRVHDAVKVRLRDLQPIEKQIERQIAELTASLQQTSKVGAGSDLVRARLVEMMRKLGWRISTSSSETLANQLVGPLSELVAVARQASQVPIPLTFASRSSLAKFLKSAATSSRRTAAEIDALSAAERMSNIASAIIDRAREARIFADQIERLIEVQIPSRVSEREDVRRQISSLSNALAGIDPNTLPLIALRTPETTVKQFQELAPIRRVELETNLRAVRSELNRLHVMHERSANLIEELRQVAIQFLDLKHDDTQCPLCNTTFAPGELFSHIKKDIDRGLDHSHQDLLARRRELEGAYRGVIADEAAAIAFVSFCARTNLSDETSLREVMQAINRVRDELSLNTSRLDFVEQVLAGLEAQGLRWEDLEPTRIELLKRRFPLSSVTQEGISALLAQIDRVMAEQTEALTTATKELDTRKTLIAALVGRNVENALDGRSALSELDQLRESAESLSVKLNSFDATFRIPMTKSLGELAVEAEGIRQVALELQATLRKEEETNSLRAQSEIKRRTLEQQLAQLTPRVRKLSSAASVFLRLQRDYPLNEAMQAAIRENRKAIETIFGRIHAPYEFAGLGKELTSLVRTDGGDASLSQISTGQRAALGLSMFLAQNMKLRFAPPVILIDDPIAHVDDLNCLAFLDYLREIALTGRRQIFFATANDKLASMFERKFDFLGPQDFQKIILHREA